MSIGYDLYVQWCRDHGRVPPTKEWWDWACAQANRDELKSPLAQDSECFQREIDRERREGWGYDDH